MTRRRAGRKGPSGYASAALVRRAEGRPRARNTLFVWVDYRMPIAPLRDELKRIVEAAPEWDWRVCVLQVTDVGDRATELRVLVSTQDAGLGRDLRCEVREQLIAYMQSESPEYLPRLRTTLLQDGGRREDAAAPAHATHGAVARTEPITP